MPQDIENNTNTVINRIRNMQEQRRLRQQTVIQGQQEKRQLNLQNQSMGRNSLIDSSSTGNINNQQTKIPTSSLSNLQQQNDMYNQQNNMQNRFNYQDSNNMLQRIQALKTPNLDVKSKSNVNASNVIQAGESYIGTPYKWGGNDTSGIDCSGFTKNVFASQGIELPRTALEQSKGGTSVAFKDLEPGDLIFFDTVQGNGKDIDHVGIYAGNGQMLHSGSSKGVSYTDLSSKYWQSKFKKAKRY